MLAISQRRLFRMQWPLIFILAILLLGTVVASWRHNDGQRNPGLALRNFDVVLRDFNPFYCAGATSNTGGNPYLWKDFDRCSSRPAYDPAPPSFNHHRLPAPLPGYDVALFRVLAILPYPYAAYLWLALCSLGLLVSVRLLARTCRLPPIVVFAALAVPMFREALSGGQLPPLAITALSIAAYAIEHKRYRLAGISAACTLIEPHLGLPVCLAMLLWLPRVRLSLTLACIALAALSVATLGFAENVEYVRNVLPAQVLAEASFRAQYSLTWLAYFFGLNENAAIRLGEISYYAAVAFGIVLARFVAQALQAPEAIPFAAAAAAAIGGPYLHNHQIEIAVLLALMLAGRRGGVLAWSSVAILSVLWFAVPWTTGPWDSARIASAAAIGMITAYACKDRSATIRTSAALGAAVFYIVVTTLILHAPHGPFRAPESMQAYAERIATIGRYSSAQWGFAVRSHGPPLSLRDAIYKLPLWFALALLVLAALRARTRRTGVSAHP